MIWYPVSVIANLSVIYSLLAVYAWYKKLIVVKRPMLNVMLGYIFLNIFITLAFLFEYMFLSKRYLVALSLVLMLWVPFALEDLLQKWSRKKWPVIVAIFFIFISSVGGIVKFGYSKHYIHDAGVWLAKNTPPEAKIYSNDSIVMYYSQRFGSALFEKNQEFKDPQVIALGNWKKYDYLALRINKKTAKNDSKDFIEINKQHPLVIFANERGDEVRIYKVHG
jgi:hypothetical protein